MGYDIRVEQVSSRPLAVVRRRAKLAELPKVIPAACGEAWNAVKAMQLKGGRLVALYLDDEMNLEVGVELDAPIADQDGIFASATPAGEVAAAVHFGPYQRLAEAHQAIRQWCVTHHRALAGPNWELYAHWQDDWKNNPSEIRTDVYYLLKSDGSGG
jgi:effector-binding domain-containing protein